MKHLKYSFLVLIAVIIPGLTSCATVQKISEEQRSAYETDMVSVITESAIIIGDQSDGVFTRGKTVILSPYSIGKYQVTQKFYALIMGKNPSHFSSEPAEGETQELRPVEQVNWYHSIAFCNKLSLMSGYAPCYSVKNSSGKEIDWKHISHSDIPVTRDAGWDAAVCDMTKNGYRLPTEAEWEFAARGGDQTASDWYYIYSDSDTMEDAAWCYENSGKKTHEVGKKTANRLGIYDMSGNVGEWCNDWYRVINAPETVINPQGDASGSFRVQRGTSYSSFNSHSNATIRFNLKPEFIGHNYGFRLARSADNWKKEHDKAVSEPEKKKAEIINKINSMILVTAEPVEITGDTVLDKDASWNSGVFLKGRTVTLSPYSIGKYQVTQELYAFVMGINPSHFSENPANGEIQKLRPVGNISWYRAITFCNKLSLMSGYDLCYSVKDSSGKEIDWKNISHSDIPVTRDTKWDAAVCDMTKNGYRLPTEAEWEFAARGGDQNATDWNYKYSGSDTIEDVAWCYENSDIKTHEVGKKGANRLGIYDMSGNIFEWCNDWYREDISTSETVFNPRGAASGSKRIQRGAAYNSYSSHCAVTIRFKLKPEFIGYNCGIRLARSAGNRKEEHNKTVNEQKQNKFENINNTQMVSVIKESVKITGDQSSGVFSEGRTVTLSPYSIGQYQVTQELYAFVMGTNPSVFCSDPANSEAQESRPVEQINWYHAIAFCNRLSMIKGYNLCYSVKDSSGREIDWKHISHSDIPTIKNAGWDAAVCDMTKNGYRLPTEAEWEFAARGGDQNASDWNYTYSGSDTIGYVAWYYENAGSETHEVGKKTANRLGIYDMSGNVCEWCNDWYGDINTSETVINPQGVISGSVRVQRGGFYDYQIGSSYDVAGRDYSYPYYCSSYCGFRLVRSGSN